MGAPRLPGGSGVKRRLGRRLNHTEGSPSLRRGCLVGIRRRGNASDRFRGYGTRKGKLSGSERVKRPADKRLRLSRCPQGAAASGGKWRPTQSLRT
jgi:hypothetical protein